MNADERGFICHKKAQKAQRWGERPRELARQEPRPTRLRLTEPHFYRGFNRAPAESAARSALPHPLRLDRGEPDATLAHRMGEGLGVRA
jgi:hypothetical protein